MVTLHSCARLIALGATLCLALDAPARAQVVAPASQPTRLNPYAGLRGAPQRGLPLRGDSARGVNLRPTGPQAQGLWLARGAGPQRENAPASSPSTTPAATTPPVAAPGAGPGAGPAAFGRPGAGLPAWKRATPERIRTRLIALDDGRTLRTASQRVDGAWRVLGRGGWQTLPATEVVDVALEIEVLAEARLRRRDMDRSDLGERLAEVAWLLDVGLVREALDQLDALLQDDASAERAAALVTRGALPDSVLSDALRRDHAGARPHSIDGWLAIGARARPSVQELVVLELLEHGMRQRNELERRLAAVSAGTDARRASFAGLALRRLFPGR